jgi:hypothetical protein
METGQKRLGRPVTAPPSVRFDRFVERVPEAGCWIWMGSMAVNGYGMFKVRAGEQVLAHRFAYERAHGAVPDGLSLDHLCRVRCCVNPVHLEPVTTRVNILRGVGVTSANARKTHCHRGHEFTPENTVRAGRNGEGRRCRICRQRDAARARARA